MGAVDRNAQPDVPWPNRKALQDMLARLKPCEGASLDSAEVDEVIEAIRFTLGAVDPSVDYSEIVSQNPLHKVCFRAGLLACREHIARMIDGFMVGGPKEIARTVRVMWFPVLGPDPGPPRRFTYDEVAVEVPQPDGSVRIESRPIDASTEALPRALAFVEGITRE
jgi:hypothetical protein